MSKQKNVVSKDNSKQTKPAPAPKQEGPKLPYAEAKNNSTLKCQVAEYGGLTWLCLKNFKGEINWRACSLNNFKKAMEKAEAIRADANLTDAVKDAKVAEAIKSYAQNSIPLDRVPFTTVNPDAGFDKAEAEKQPEVKSEQPAA
jgi:hypothetical protein